MINQSDVIEYKKKGFDGDKYIEEQKGAILERISHFPGKLYLEIGGKFLIDQHASRVLPGFYPNTKTKIFADLIEQSVIVFCVNARDIVKNRQLSNEDISYADYVEGMLHDIKSSLDRMPRIVVNMCNSDDMSDVNRFVLYWQDKGYKVYKRCLIEGYPMDLDKIISDDGFGKDDYIDTDKKLVLVTGAASNSGKMSTCLGQIFLDRKRGMDSGYAKYETFPIWNIDLEHPINLAYEAATADIDDYNCYDIHYKKAYNENVVNYNRDVDAYPLLASLIKKIAGKDNWMKNYQSPTEMGISRAGFCIIDEAVISRACEEEIVRRKSWYQEMVERGNGDQKRVDKCEELLFKIKKTD